MQDNQKVLIKNLTNHSVGFGCKNFPNSFDFNAGQTLSVRWEYLLDATYVLGLRFLFENSYLKIDPKTENYEEVMEELQLSHLKEKIDNALSYDEVKRILSINPLSTQYGVIKKQLKEGTVATKENFAKAAIELEIKDYTVNEAIEKATGINVANTLKLKATPKKKEEE